MKLKNILTRPFHKIRAGGDAFDGVSREEGMSLIEIIIVMALVGGLMAVIATQVVAGMKTAKEGQVKLSFNQLKSAIQMYKLNNNAFPTSEQGLASLLDNPGNAKNWRGPYTESELLSDPWGQPIAYESDGKTYAFVSGGNDELIGTEDDIRFPEAKVPTAGPASAAAK